MARTHVGVNRRSGVRGEVFYTAGYVHLKRVFVDIVVENVVPGSSEALILASTLEWVKELGLEVGGFKLLEEESSIRFFAIRMVT